MAHSLHPDEIAHEMKTAQDDVLQIEPFTSRLGGFDVPAAYAVAHLIHEARLREGAVPVGRKIGFTNPDMWSRYGVREPILKPSASVCPHPKGRSTIPVCR